MTGSSFLAGAAIWAVMGWGGSCKDKLVMSFSTKEDELESLCVIERKCVCEREREGGRESGGRGQGEGGCINLFKVKKQNSSYLPEHSTVENC